MEVYDDRPISVYDNLKTPTNIHTSTPIAKSATTFTPAASSSPSSSPSSSSLLPTTTTAVAPAANGATRSPIYTDISFMFNDNNKQQQQRAEPSQLLPSSNRSLNPNRLPTASQVHSNSIQAPYEYKAATNTTPPQYRTSPAPAQPLPTPLAARPLPAAQNISTATATTATDAAANAATAVATTLTTAKQPTAAMNASPAQRPLSQHSQSELNEASQSIAAVKAALNDAKSKFFGLNGYAQDKPSVDTNESRTPPQPHSHHPACLPPDSQIHYPRVQIVTSAPAPPPKPQPKYQNIPENSAIFRNRPPPELPPKPESVALAPAGGSSPKMSTTTPQTPMSTASPSTSTTPISAAQSPQSPTAAQAKTLPYTAYKQLPLNDIDTSQPSQAVYMSTTVPQNIKGSKIAGRHTPTRNSLRHSRMLVVNNKNYQGTQHPNPMNFKYPNLARWLLILEIIVGILISFLSIWIFFLAPSTAVQDNPYWSGLALLLTGILGLVLVRYQRIKRHKVRENCFLFLRADSYLLALLTVLLCCVALICAAIHYARLSASDTKCVSTNILLEHGSCTCTFNAVDVPPANDTADLANGLLDEEIVPENFEDLSYKVEYRDLSCSEVDGAWTCILGISIALNSLGLLVSLIYVVLLACFRHSSKRFYTSVHTSTF